MNNQPNVFAARILLVTSAIFLLGVLVSQAQAGITRDLVIHNYRDEAVSVKVVKTDGSYLDREVESRATCTIYVGDNEMGTTWIYYADSNGAEIDRVAVWETRTDYHLDIY